MAIGCRDQGGESVEEVEGIEDQSGSALSVGPGPPQVVEDPSVAPPGKALLREGSAQSVAAEALEPGAVVGGNGMGGTGDTQEWRGAACRDESAIRFRSRSTERRAP
jgi:hypothetical protein